MKKSELKNLIREAMLEAMPEIIEIMMENINELYSPQQAPTKPRADLSVVREHTRSSILSNNDDYDLPSINNEPKHVANIPTPSNPKEVIGGEVFASGRGIMEWFEKQNGIRKPASEFSHTNKDMDSFISKKFGVKK